MKSVICVFLVYKYSIYFSQIREKSKLLSLNDFIENQKGLAIMITRPFFIFNVLIKADLPNSGTIL